MSISGPKGRFEGRFRPDSRPSGRTKTRPSSYRLPQRAPQHPQVGRCKQRVQLRGVLGQPAVALLRMPELALDHPERVFDLGPNARLGLHQLVHDRAHRGVLVQYFAFARAHGYAPVDVDLLRLFPLAHSAMSGGASFIAGPEKLNHCYMNEVDAQHGLTADGGCRHLVPGAARAAKSPTTDLPTAPTDSSRQELALTRALGLALESARAEAHLFHVLSVSHRAWDTEVLQIFLNLNTLQQFVSADPVAGFLFSLLY